MTSNEQIPTTAVHSVSASTTHPNDITSSPSLPTTTPSTDSKPKGRLRGRRRADAEGALTAEDGAVDGTAAASSPGTKFPQRIVRVAPQIPADLLENTELARAISVLPSNYNFELYKTIWRIREAKAKMVGLQFPEGLLIQAEFNSTCDACCDVRFAGVETVIMGDVTYGACCVDDFTARALGCDFMVHYGHSCLVRSLIANFDKDAKLVLAGTIQFATAMTTVSQELKAHFKEMYIPQAKPLSKGEVLGCTSPKFEGYDAVIFLADGRFHLESLMIHNPHINAFYKYDPYNKKLTRESYAYTEMHSLRQSAIQKATTAKKWGLILGTLGRQGNMNILQRLEGLLKDKNREYVIVLLSEIFPDKLAKFGEVEAWVQVACPRLSIDWGYAFSTPLLSSYEAEVALGISSWLEIYPMDYYSDAGGTWSNYHAVNKQSHQALDAKSINPIRARKEAKAAAAAAAAALGTTNTATPKMEIAYSTEN